LPEARLDPVRERRVRRQGEAAGELGGREPPRQLQKRERVAARLGDDSIAHPFVQRAGDDGAEQPSRVAVTEPFDRELRQARELVLRFARGEDQGDGLREQTARDEGERLQRGAVEPLRVVDDTHERAVTRDIGQQAQHRQADEEAIVWSRTRQAERRAQGVPLRVWQAPDPIEHRPAQLVQPRERELHLRVDSGGPRDAQIRRRFEHVLEKRRLPDPGIAAHDQHTARPGPHGVEHTIECRTLAASPPQNGSVARVRSVGHRGPRIGRPISIRYRLRSLRSERLPRTLRRHTVAPGCSSGRSPRGRSGCGMRMTIVGVVAVIAALLSGSPAFAITNGQPDGERHPYVALMQTFDEDGVPLQVCTGSLLSPTVFLTAAHCVAEPPAVHAEVWFDQGPILPDIDYLLALFLDPDFSGSCDDSPAFDGYPCQGDAGGTPHPHPDFCFECAKGLPNAVSADVGVVVLDDPVSASIVGEYADLPSTGQVDTLPNKSQAEFVGYGVQVQTQFPGRFLPKPPPFFRWSGAGERMHARGELVSGSFAHSDEFMRFSMNAADGSGGICFGDSGGPDLLAGTDTVLAVNSYVTNMNCRGVGYSQRVDVPDVRNWVEGFME
jgi:hypothetical protein